MRDIEDILREWEKDAVIDSIELDKSSIDTSKLHSKYLDYYTQAKLLYARRRAKFDELKRDKWMYYSGRMSKLEMDQRGWVYDPFKGGTKPLKSDLDIFINSDKDVSEEALYLEYLKTTKETLESILENIKWRSNTIKNIIEHRKFTSGI